MVRNKILLIMMVGAFVLVPASTLVVNHATATEALPGSEDTSGDGATDDTSGDGLEKTEKKKLEIESRQAELEKKKDEAEKRKTQALEKKTEAKEVKDTDKEQRLEKIKKEANKKIDSAIKKLNSIKERVAKMSQIPDADKTELNTKIDERIALLEAKKLAVIAATTKEEVKAALDGSIKDMRDTKDLVKSIVDSIHKKHISNIISKMSAMIVKIEGRLAKLTGDKTEREAAIALAKTDLIAAQTALDAGNIEEAKAALKKVHQDLKNALSKKKSSSDDSSETQEKEGVENETN